MHYILNFHQSTRVTRLLNLPLVELIISNYRLSRYKNKPAPLNWRHVVYIDNFHRDIAETVGEVPNKQTASALIALF